MSINLKSTKNFGTKRGVRMVCYGLSGAGKTQLIRTLPNPVVLSAESGLLTLGDWEIPYEEATSLEKVREFHRWLIESEESQGFESVAIDSVSEIAEVVLSHEKGKSADPRKAYGSMQDELSRLIRDFRDLPGSRHVYFTAKCERMQDETGKTRYAPSMPGAKMGQSVPYYFDVVLAARVERTAEGATERALQTQDDGVWLAKTRGGKLDAWEPMDLGAVIGKITGGASDGE